MIKYTKFKFNKNSVIFFISLFCYGTRNHISRNTCIPRNVVWETLQP